MEVDMILRSLQEKLTTRSREDFKYRQFSGEMIIQAVSWYLRYALGSRDIEELFLERGVCVWIIVPPIVRC